MKNKKALGWGELILGTLLILLGIYSFLHPTTALTGAAVVYGIFALVSGVLDIVYYAKLERRTGFGPVFSLVGGILSVAAGLLLLLNVASGVWMLALFFPLWFIAHCVARLAHLSFLRMFAGTGYHYFTLVVNCIGLFLGVLMIVNPLVSLISSSYVIGGYLLLLGLDSLVFAFTLLDPRR